MQIVARKRQSLNFKIYFYYFCMVIMEMCSVMFAEPTIFSIQVDASLGRREKRKEIKRLVKAGKA